MVKVNKVQLTINHLIVTLYTSPLAQRNEDKFRFDQFVALFDCHTRHHTEQLMYKRQYEKISDLLCFRQNHKALRVDAVELVKSVC